MADAFDSWMTDQGMSAEQVAAARADDAPSERSAHCRPGARLCKVEVRIQPSGRRLYHGSDCPDSPGARIAVGEYARGTRLTSEGWRRATR